MNHELLASGEREVLGWPGVSKETHLGGSGVGDFWIPPFTLYRLGRRELGHVHDTGVADLPFPKVIHDTLIANGRAEPHGAGFPGVVSYPIRKPEDVPGAVALFRLNSDRANAAVGRRRAA
jgi:hypothetical protein